MNESHAAQEVGGVQRPVGIASSGEPVAVTRPEIVAPGLRRVVAIIAAASFLVMSFGHALVDLVAPVPAPTLIGAEKHEQEERRAKARFLDGSLAKLAEENLRLTSRVRRLALAVYTPMLVRWFQMAGKDKVVGPDGTFFLRDRIAVPAEPRDDVVGRAIGRIAALSRYLGRLGCHVVAVPLPRKSAVEAARLPAGIDSHPDYDRELIAGLLAIGVDAVDLWPEFTAPRNERTYAWADSHWSTSAELVAARAVARRLQPDRPLREPALVVQATDDGAFVAQSLGLEPVATAFLPAHPIVIHHLADPGLARCYRDAPPNGDLPLLLTGTSFSTRSDGTPMLFVSALSAMLDRPIWNGARPGASPMSTLAEALRSIAGRPYPAEVVMEMPNHQLLCHPSPLWDMNTVFEVLPVVPGLQSLQHASPDRFSIPGFLDGSAVQPGHIEVPNGPRLVSRILADTFLYPRDGTVSVILRGHLQGELTVNADVGADGVYVRWRADRKDLVVPVAGNRIGSTLDVVIGSVGGPATLDLESIDVVCDLDVARGIEGVPTETPRTPDRGWQQTLAFDAALRADGCVGLMIDRGDAPPTDLVVTVSFADGTDVTLLGSRQVASRASLLLPLGPGARRVRTVSVAGADPSPTRAVRAFLLERLPR